MSSRFFDLQVAALRVRNADPEAWELFLYQLSETARRTTNTLVSVDQSAILTTQGQAQMAVALFDALLKCEDAKPKPPVPQAPQEPYTL